MLVSLTLHVLYGKAALYAPKARCYVTCSRATFWLLSGLGFEGHVGTCAYINNTKPPTKSQLYTSRNKRQRERYIQIKKSKWSVLTVFI